MPAGLDGQIGSPVVARKRTVSRWPGDVNRDGRGDLLVSAASLDTVYVRST